MFVTTHHPSPTQTLCISCEQANEFKDFGNGYTDKEGKLAIEPAMLGFISSSYQLGSVFGVPVAPFLNQRFGRRWSIMVGSLIMSAGAIIQCFAQHGT